MKKPPALKPIRLRRISLYPLTLDQALATAMRAKPLAAKRPKAAKNGKRKR